MAKKKEDALELQWRAWLATLDDVKVRKGVPFVSLPIEVERGGKTCVFRFKRPGAKAETTKTLGSVSQRIADIVRKAEVYAEMLARGVDPSEEKRLQKEAEAEARKRHTTLREVGEKFITDHEQGWSNPVHRQQWRNTLRTYVWPFIGDMPIRDVDNPDILRVLEPIWHKTPETAGRIRGRLEQILDSARFNKLHDGPNPAAWKGNLKFALPSRAKIRPVKHHAALDWREMPGFVANLRARRDSFGAWALMFTILTGARSGETRGCRWNEIDVAAALWTVPAPKMKARREHRVPLSAPALEVLRAALAVRESESPDALVFPGMRPGTLLSDMTLTAVLKRMDLHHLTAHGFRSSFRDWCAETGQPEDIAEAALAHALGKTQAAYQRGDLLERRRTLMQAWADYCEPPAPRNEAVDGEMAEPAAA